MKCLCVALCWGTRLITSFRWHTNMDLYCLIVSVSRIIVSVSHMYGASFSNSALSGILRKYRPTVGFFNSIQRHASRLFLNRPTNCSVTGMSLYVRRLISDYCVDFRLAYCVQLRACSENLSAYSARVQCIRYIVHYITCNPNMQLTVPQLSVFQFFHDARIPSAVDFHHTFYSIDLIIYFMLSSLNHSFSTKWLTTG